jgi:EAL and modified HD-GYP domain-containing signal transduction protein
MDVFIARQPILNEHRRLFAYELLYRGMENDGEWCGEKATASLLSASFLTEGIDVISGSKPCFINFTSDLLLKNVPATFPSSKVVVEVLEGTAPTPEILKACGGLRAAGYTIALDDFVYDRQLEPLVALADIVKIDFRLLSEDAIRWTQRRLSRFPVKLLAEKVETYDEFRLAHRLGFKYFQGYFFSRPEVFRIQELAAIKTSLIALMAEVSRSDTSIDRLETIIGKDVAISYKLLKYINSAYFYRLSTIESVRHAIVYLGEKEIRRFLLLVIISEIATDKPGELVRLALTRARFCELLAKESSFRSMADELFLLGLFSLLDAMLDVPMATVVDRLPLQQAMKSALLEQTGPLAPFLRAITAIERNDAGTCLEALGELDIDRGLEQRLYLDAVAFTESVMQF